MAPDQILSPVVVVSAPSIISKCDRFTLDISASKNSGGRRWRFFDINVTDAKGDSPKTNATLAVSKYFKENFSVSPPMRLPAGIFDISMYKLEVTLINFLGGVGSATFNVLVVSKAVPVVNILGESLRSMTRKQLLSLTATAATTQCSESGVGVTSTANLEFEWSISLNNNRLDDIVSTTKVKTAYKLSAFTLAAGNLYDIKLSVLYTVASTSASASTKVFVVQSNLVASVAGGAERGIKPNTVMVLDGSGSYDEDLSPNEEASFSYAWTCMTLQPAVSSDCAKLQLTSSSQTVSISAAIDSEEGSVYRITLTIRDSTRSSGANVNVVILDPGQPSVTVITSFSQRFNPTDMLVVEADVKAIESEPASCTWSAVSDSGNSIALQPLAITPIAKTILAAQNEMFVLALFPSSLPERFLVTFSLTCKKSVARVHIETNGPPTNGVFNIKPPQGKDYGVEFNDIFELSASLWVDDDLPLAFAFSFGDTRETIKPMGHHLTSSRLYPQVTKVMTSNWLAMLLFTIHYLLVLSLQLM